MGTTATLIEPKIGSDNVTPTALTGLPEPLKKTARLGSDKPTMVLVAHEPDEFRFELVSKLRAAGYNVNSTNDSKQTLMALYQQQPDVLVLQQELPGLSGTELVKTFHSFAEKVKFIVLILSENEIPREVRELLKIDYVMTKPVTADEVVARIARINRGKDTV